MTTDAPVDGNALAGPLILLFGREMTDARCCCAACGAVHRLGALPVTTARPAPSPDVLAATRSSWSPSSGPPACAFTSPPFAGLTHPRIEGIATRRSAVNLLVAGPNRHQCINQLPPRVRSRQRRSTLVAVEPGDRQAPD